MGRFFVLENLFGIHSFLIVSINASSKPSSTVLCAEHHDRVLVSSDGLNTDSHIRKIQEERVLQLSATHEEIPLGDLWLMCNFEHRYR